MSKTKKIITICLVIIAILAIVGIASYFIYKSIKDKQNSSPNDYTQQKPNNPSTSSFDYLKTNNLVSNIGLKTGFIGNNYNSIQNDLLFKNQIYNNKDKPLSKDNFLSLSNIYNKPGYNTNPLLYLSFNAISDHNLVGMDINDNQTNLRIGHWNTKNFDLLPPSDLNLLQDWKNGNYNFSKDLVHAYFIASLISVFNFDLIGLTEINANVPTINLNNFINLLNSFTNDNRYLGILSENLSGKTITNKDQIEKIAIIYNKNTININQTKIYPNPLYELNANKQFILTTTKPTNPIDIKKYYDYVRPPFCISFSPINNLNKKYSIAYSHNDSPGKKTGTDPSGNKIDIEILSPISSIGMKEYFEAQQINNVLTWLNGSTFEPNSLNMYMGDTNIVKGKESVCFNTINKKTYDFAFLDNDYYSSSLSSFNKVVDSTNNIITSINSNINKTNLTNSLLNFYTNPYDKIIYNSKITINKFNFENNDNFIPTFSDQTLSNEYVNKFNQLYSINILSINKIIYKKEL